MRLTKNRNIHLCAAWCFALVIFAVIALSNCTRGRWSILVSNSSNHATSIEALAFVDYDHGWAVNPWQVLETRDGGQSWVEQLTEENESYYSLSLISPTTIWVTGSQKREDGYTALLIRTIDGGKTWSRPTINVKAQSNVRIAPRLFSISFCNPKNGWAVGSNLIIHTTDGGETWETQRYDNKNEDFLSVACISPESASVVGTSGIILQTNDSGKSWTRQESGTENTLLRVRFFNGVGWAIGLDGTLLRTLNKGMTWEKMELNLPESLADIYFTGSQGWLVGLNGTILHTSDGGQIWKPQKSPTDNDLISLFFLDAQHGWAGGNKLTILRFTG